MMKKNLSGCLVLIFLICCSSLISWASPPHRYAMPATLTVDIQPQEPVDFRKGVQVKVLVQSKIGTAKDIELKFYTGSTRLIPDQTVINIPEIRENTPKEIIVNLRQTGAARIKAGDRWFAAYCSYQPDYPSLLEFMRANANEYPNQTSRAALLGKIKAYQEENTRWRKSLTYDFE